MRRTTSDAHSSCTAEIMKVGICHQSITAERAMVYMGGTLHIRGSITDEDMISMHTTKHGELHEDEGDQQSFLSREEGPKLIRFVSPMWRPKNNSSSFPSRTKNDAQVTYKVRFGCYLYGWKDNFKELPMKLVSGPNLLGVNRNR